MGSAEEKGYSVINKDTVVINPAVEGGIPLLLRHFFAFVNGKKDLFDNRKGLITRYSYNSDAALALACSNGGNNLPVSHTDSLNEVNIILDVCKVNHVFRDEKLVFRTEIVTVMDKISAVNGNYISGL